MTFIEALNCFAIVQFLLRGRVFSFFLSLSTLVSTALLLITNNETDETLSKVIRLSLHKKFGINCIDCMRDLMRAESTTV